MWYKLAQQLQLPGLDVEKSAPKSKETSDPKEKSPELLETQKEPKSLFFSDWAKDHYVPEQPLYHGTTHEFDRFDINKIKVIQGMMNNLSEAKEEDAVDTITMDIPLFIRMLEYSREDAAEDMDLHDVTEKAISLGKERGILQMDDYDEIIGTTKKVNESIKRKISETLDKINEELCPAGKAYRKRRIAAGEKSSAYLSGRAVKVCKGQMSGKKKKK